MAYRWTLLLSARASLGRLYVLRLCTEHTPQYNQWICRLYRIGVGFQFTTVSEVLFSSRQQQIPDNSITVVEHSSSSMIVACTRQVFPPTQTNHTFGWHIFHILLEKSKVSVKPPSCLSYVSSPVLSDSSTCPPLPTSCTGLQGAVAGGEPVLLHRYLVGGEVRDVREYDVSASS